MRAARTAIAYLARFNWKRLAIEYALLQVVLLAYTVGRFLVRPGGVTPFHNAYLIMQWQEALRLNVELGVQGFFMGVQGTIPALNWYYSYIHFTPMMVFLVWVYLYHNHAYPLVRNTFLASTLIGFVVHWVFPTAPPRLVSALGITDTLAVGGSAMSYDQGVVGTWANQYAAVPSFHFGWALFAAVGVILLARTPWRWLALLHPAIQMVTIVATGNHFILDAVAVVPVMGVPALVVYGLHVRGAAVQAPTARPRTTRDAARTLPGDPTGFGSRPTAADAGDGDGPGDR